jgi:Domain of unknown function (DUF1905)
LKVKKKTFKAEVLTGHKDNAVAVPFDPATEWGLSPEPLWRGRRGHAVTARINDISFESAIVRRQKQFYLLIDSDAAKAAQVSAGDLVRVAVEPNDE